MERIVVLAGGKSPEREVSLKSGVRIAEALRRRGYRVALVDPSKEYGNEAVQAAFSESGQVDFSVFCHAEQGFLWSELPELTEGALRICRAADTVFLALHGGGGENGLIAAVLEAFGVKHTGSGFCAMGVAMDKLLSKRIFRACGVLTPGFTVCNAGELPCQTEFPCVVKPVSSGSSIGVSIVKNKEELLKAVTIATAFSESALIEQFIKGREFTVGVLDGAPLEITEIIPRSGFYGYGEKYTAALTEEITPALLDGTSERAVKDAAIAAHNALMLGFYSRVDVILEEKSGLPYVLEVNALPGMTELSLLPLGAAACGICFDELCERILRGCSPSVTAPC